MTNPTNVIGDLSIEQRLAGLREIVDERDRLYSERHQTSQIALQTALASAEKAVNAALAAAKEASFEQKEALKEYKTASNEWRATVTDLSGRLSELGEIKAEMRAVHEKVNELRRGESKMVGGNEALAVAKRNTLIIVGLALTVAIFIIREFFLKGTP